MKNAYDIVIKPHITERSVALSYGDPRLSDEEAIRKYTFVVDTDANKIEIKKALEFIYNSGKKKKDDMIEITSVRTVLMKGKSRRVGHKNSGKRRDWKKAIVTLAKGQRLDDYGV